MPKRFVYVLKNSADPPRYYTGLTTDMTRRLAEHNAGSCTTRVVVSTQYNPANRPIV